MDIREATKELHSMVEETKFALRLLNGDISLQDHIRYLNAQYVIFHPLESDIYHNKASKNLLRCDLILKDLDYLGELKPLYDIPEVAIEYSLHIASLQGNQFNSHMYLNYLGMLFGGSIMAKNAPSTFIYKFEDRQDCIKEIRSLELDVDEVNRGYAYHIAIFEELESMRNER